MPKLTEYRVTVDITQATGIRVYRVFAESDADALALVKSGDAMCIDEQLEVEQIEYEGAVVEKARAEPVKE